MDIPVIKPRTTVNNKNEFNVVIQKTAEVDIADMSLFDKPLLQDAKETLIADLQAQKE